MINLMYLVFIAMLAMQMSKEVLSAFGYMNEKFSETNITADARNSATLQNLATKALEQPEKYQSLNATALKVHEMSKKFSDYLDAKSTFFLKDEEDSKKYEAMDKTDLVDNHFFKGDTFTKEGKEFLDQINGYRDGIIELIGEDNMLSAAIINRFDTSDKAVEGGKQKWLNNRYEGFPLITTVTNLTSMKSDIKTTESEIYSLLLGGQLESDVSMTKYEAIVIPEKTAFFQGETFKGKIVLGKVDPTLKPKSVKVNGATLPESSLQAGQVLLSFGAGAVGERDIVGEFVFTEKGKDVVIPIRSSYAVIPKPNSAVISADKMNVVYRGVSNPMTISIPGVPDNLVTATGNGLNRSSGAGKYTMTPGSGSEVKISVSGKLPDGTSVSSSQNFRIKDIPSPSGAVRKESGYVKMPSSSLENSTVSAELADFDFDLNLSTTGFTIKVPGQGAVVVRGNRMDSSAQKAISKAKRGDVIVIFDIKSSLSGSSIRIKDASAVSIEIQ